MPDPVTTNHIPEAAPARRRRFSLVWLVPLAALAVGGWLVVKTLSEKGPQVTVAFKTAEGLEAGKTVVKFKDLAIGRVTSIQIGEDRRHVVATLDMDKTAENLLQQTTRLWVVRPRMDLSGISGLGTLVSGAYIELDPGTGGKRADFTGLEIPPIIRSDVPGTEFTLLTTSLGSIGTRTPIFYRSVKVGEVLGYEFADDRRTMVLRTFIFAPYDGYITARTNFWNVSGIDIEVGTQGFKVRMQSLEVLISGGIAFETPPGGDAAPKADEGTVFTLHENLEAIGRLQITEHIPFLAHFEDSVGGLAVGAAVEFKGIRVGTVKQIRPQIDLVNLDIRVAVVFDLEPQAFLGRTDVTGTRGERYGPADALVRRGLRAQLETKSLVTGQQVVALGIFKDLPVEGLRRGGVYPEIPTQRSTINTIADSASQFLVKLNALPLDALIGELNTASRTLNETLTAARGLIGDTRAETKPLLSGLRKLADRAQAAIGKAQTTFETVNDAVAPNSNTLQSVNQMLAQLSGAARSLRLLADYLERHPEALVRGKPSGF